jgi:hypothetical protein
VLFLGCVLFTCSVRVVIIHTHLRVRVKEDIEWSPLFVYAPTKNPSIFLFKIPGYWEFLLKTSIYIYI